jgi:hypothetical protein
MQRSISLVLLCAAWHAGAANNDDAIAKVGVLVRTLGDAPGTIVEKAEDECQRAFLRAGIKITWINAAADVAWEGPDIVLRAAILPRAPRSRGLDVFGSALPNRREGVQLFVYYERVFALSRQAEVPVHLVLSGALTHELGHLLLRSSEHSVVGVMRGVWGKRELEELSQGRLRFAPEETRQIRANIQSMAARK